LPGATLARLDGGHVCNVTQAHDFDRILLGWLDAALTEGVF
jgi:hypothetical protein